MTLLSDSPMVEAVTLLAVMRKIGLHVRLDDGGQLRVGPQAMLWPYDVEYIKEMKPALVSLLAAEQSGMGTNTTPAEKIAQNANMARCGTCLHFLPDTVNPAQGVGTCSVTSNGMPPIASRGYGCCYPMAPRTCPSYERNET